MNFTKKMTLAATVCMCVFVAAGLAGCGSAADPAESTPDPNVEAQYLPKVYTDSDGDLIQLTPYDDMDDIVYFQQRGLVPYNTYYLDADGRGCKSCHDDLRELLADSPYEHCAVRGADVEWNIYTCLDCHTSGTNGYYTNEYELADWMHRIHADTATCYSCHYSDTPKYGSEGTAGMKLWEDVKYSKLRGITDLESASSTDNFAYNQDMLSDVRTDLFYLNDEFHDWDKKRTTFEEQGEPLDYKLRDEWTITIGGSEVEKVKTFVLGDLLSDPNTPMVTRTIKWNCMISPIGGPGVGQIEVTGIPLSYLTDQCGIKDTATGVRPQGDGGFSDYGCVHIEQIMERDPIIALQMNGEDLTWINGFPCTLVLGNGLSAGAWAKEFCEIDFTAADTECFDIEGWPWCEAYDFDTAFYDIAHGWPNAEYSDFYNSPNVGLFKLKEGQVIKTGETLTVEGYADAFVDEITGVEVSTDRGATWKRYDISGTDTEKLITFNFDFTPEEDGAYVLMVRSVRADGKVTEHSIDRMVVARSDVDEIAATATELA